MKNFTLKQIFPGLGEAGFSMVRLKTIAKQRELFSSIESLSQSSSDEEVILYNHDLIARHLSRIKLGFHGSDVKPKHWPVTSLSMQRQK